MTLSPGTYTFSGQVLSVGFGDGTRMAIRRFTTSPWGGVTAVLVSRGAAGDRRTDRVLLVPTEEMGEALRAMDGVSDVVVGDIACDASPRSLALDAGPLHLVAQVGDRTSVGRALRALPSEGVRTGSLLGRLAAPLGRVLAQGTTTSTTTADGLTAQVRVTDVHAVSSATGTWSGEPLGELGPVEPGLPTAFGIIGGEPSLTGFTATVEVPQPEPLTGVIDCWGVGALRDREARDAAGPAGTHAGADHPRRTETTMSGQPTDHPTSESDEGVTGVTRERGTAGVDAEGDRPDQDAAQERMDELTDAAKDADPA